MTLLVDAISFMTIQSRKGVSSRTRNFFAPKVSATVAIHRNPTRKRHSERAWIARAPRPFARMAPKLIVVVALGAAAFLAHKAKAGGDKPAAAPKKPEIKSAPAKAASTKAAVAKPPLKNSAFVFVKPAANTAATQALVKEVFASTRSRSRPR